jgi:cytochrome d ubiquinol oxidase subunit I
VTTSGQIGTLFILFTIVYFVLGVAVVLVLNYYFKRNPVEKEIEMTMSS